MISLLRNLYIFPILKTTHPKDLIKMQTSIKMFFKAKEPTAATSPQQQQSRSSGVLPNTEKQKENKNELPSDIKTTPPRNNISEEKISDIKKGDDEPVTEVDTDSPIRRQPAKGRNKRSVLDSSDDDEEEDNKATKKRQAISPLSTPLKLQDKTMLQVIKSDDEKKITDDKPSTPIAQKGLSQEKLVNTVTTSPLLDIKVIIRKKISSGAFALHENMGVSWFRALQGEFDKPYFKKLSAFVKQERETKTVFPPEDKVFSWTHHHDIKDTRVIILGQDPYFNPRQAHGLSFSVQKGVKPPPSLLNIYKELENDIEGFKPPMNGNYTSGDLTGWAKQGVLMLNTCLTVNAGFANSHQNKGWEAFTDAVITWISKNINHKVVFLLWGRPAQRKTNLIDKRHKVLTAAHPSPLSAHNGFMGCGHFSKTNSFLVEQGLKEIDWKAL